MNNKFKILVVALLVLFGISTSCQQNDSPLISVISLMDHPVLNTVRDSFENKLDSLITQDGGEVNIINSNAQGRVENLPDLVRQVLLQSPTVVVPISTPVTQALMREADSTQKIVYSFVTNPSDLGDELIRTNSTGVSDAINYGRNIELISEIFGTDIVIGMLYNPNEANSVHGINTVKSILRDTNIKLVTNTVVRENEVPNAASQLARNVDVIYVGGDNTVVGAMPSVINEALLQNTPVIASDEGSIMAGALAGVSVDYEKLGKKTAEIVFDILKGEEPKNVPRLTLSGDKLLLNIDAAQMWNINFADSLLLNANTIID